MSKLFALISKIGNLALLNVVWVICCIPVVTFTASTAALYNVLLKYADGQDPYPVKTFWKVFKIKLKRGIPISIGIIILGAFLGFDIFFLMTRGGSFAYVYLIIVFALSILYLMSVSYIFPVISITDLSIFDSIKWSLILSVRHLFRSIIVVLLNLIPVILFLSVPSLFVLSIAFWIVIGGAIIARINSAVLIKIFKCYID